MNPQRLEMTPQSWLLCYWDGLSVWVNHMIDLVAELDALPLLLYQTRMLSETLRNHYPRVDSFCWLAQLSHMHHTQKKREGGFYYDTVKHWNSLIFPHIFVWGSCFWFCIPGAASGCRLLLPPPPLHLPYKTLHTITSHTIILHTITSHTET